jgi:hypothetical protein
MTSQFEKDVLKVGENRSEICNPYPILRQTMNHLSHEIVASTANGESKVTADHRLNSRDGAKALFSDRVVRGENDGSLRTVPVD